MMAEKMLVMPNGQRQTQKQELGFSFMDICDIFDPAARQRQMRHAANALPEDQWLIGAMAAELFSRLAEEKAVEGPVLLLGYCPNGPNSSLVLPFVHASLVNSGGSTIVCAEDHLPFDRTMFGAAIAIGTLDTVNDLPGALVQIRQCLRPGGRFLGAFAGVGSGSFLRQMVRLAEPTVARVHPQIDVRAAGDLLAEPVADMDQINIRYSSLSQLLRDVRFNGQGNALRSRLPLTRNIIEAWADIFEKARDESGKVQETACPVYVSGMVPHPR
jgi:NADH dehydrogenase [ubiquinone] 1 alpha subcomplex assembly factor 5